MKYLILVLLLAVGCVSTQEKETIAFQAARLDRALALITSGGVTQQDMESFIKGERKVWHALDYSINDNPLPSDLIVDPTKPKVSKPSWPDTVK